MNTLVSNKKPILQNVSKFDVRELNKEELTSSNGGALSGAAAVAVAVGGGLAAVAAGVLVGVAIYYGVKWLTS